MITSVKCIKHVLKIYSEKILSIMKTSSAMGNDVSRLNDEQLDRKNKCELIIEKLQLIH